MPGWENVWRQRDKFGFQMENGLGCLDSKWMLRKQTRDGKLSRRGSEKFGVQLENGVFLICAIS